MVEIITMYLDNSVLSICLLYSGGWNIKDTCVLIWFPYIHLKDWQKWPFMNNKRPFLSMN